MLNKKAIAAFAAAATLVSGLALAVPALASSSSQSENAPTLNPADGRKPAQKPEEHKQTPADKDTLIAAAEKFGLPKNVIESLKDYAKSKDFAAVEKLLKQGEKNALEEVAQKAVTKGLSKEVVEKIRKSDSLTAANAVLAAAEKPVNPVTPKPVNPVTPKPVNPVTPVTPVNPTPVVPPAPKPVNPTPNPVTPKPVNPVTPKPVNPDHTTPSEPSTPSTPSDETPSSDDTTPSSSSTTSVTTPSASTPAGASQSAPAAVAAGVPAAPASVADLLPGLKGMITVGANNVVVAGAVNRVALNISNQAFLDRLNRDGSAKAYAFIYSSPRLLKGADGANYVTVRMVNGKPQFDAMFPAGYSGKHTVVLVDEQGNQLGWTDITMKSGVSNGLPNSGVGVALTALAASVLAGAGAAFRKIRR